MPANIYIEKENGDLKLLAEVEDDVTEGEAVQMLLETNPKLKHTSYVVVTGTLEEGEIATVSQREVRQVTWASSRNGGADVEIAPDADEEEVEADEKPKSGRRRQQSSRGRSKPAARTRAKAKPKASPRRRSTPKSAPKPAARRSGGSRARAKAPAKRSGRKSGGSPFKRNPASDE